MRDSCGCVIPPRPAPRHKCIATAIRSLFSINAGSTGFVVATMAVTRNPLLRKLLSSRRELASKRFSTPRWPRRDCDCPEEDRATGKIKIGNFARMQRQRLENGLFIVILVNEAVVEDQAEGSCVTHLKPSLRRGFSKRQMHCNYRGQPPPEGINK